jgi:YcaO-like protein with predicted kinase domain
MARILPCLSRHGITRLARLTTLDKIGIPVWNAIAPNSRSIVINQGKGIDDIDARVSAAMEALERAVAGDPDIDGRLATIELLEAEGSFAEPLDCLILAGKHEVRRDEQILWTCGYDIIAERKVWVPCDALLLDDTRSNRFWQSSDGLASGNTLLEATFHGLLERIERDAEIMWQFASEAEKQENCIDISRFKDPVLSRLAKRVMDAGFLLRVFNKTSDVGVPCFEAFIAPQTTAPADLRYIEVTYGAGAHPDPVRAAIRAITEAAQSRLTYISGARDDIDPETFRRALPIHLRAVLEMVGKASMPEIVVNGGKTLNEMLTGVISKLRTVGIKSAIIVDMNPRETEFSVAKVLVPSLENPDGRRKKRVGPRAFRRVLRLR